MAASVITAALNIIALGPLALTPVQRWSAARNFKDSGSQWFIIVGIAAIGVLAAALVVVGFRQRSQRRKDDDDIFFEHSARAGLSERERQILPDIASNAKLNQRGVIFTTKDAFDRGAAQMIERSLARRRNEETEQLKIELSALREKLGFQSRPLPSVGDADKAKRFSSRQIPAGKKLHITRRTSRASEGIEAMVIENNDVELTVKLQAKAKVTFGDVWRVRYYFGSSVWEFDSSVVSFDGDALVLNHSDEVRFINRRRFLRVPVRNLAFIAPFPFARVISEGAEQTPSQADGFNWPLEFVHSVVTELAGPGLLVEAPLEVEPGERILVVFRLDESRGPAGDSGADGVPISKIIEDVGEVKHVKPVEGGFSIAVELTGLRDAELGELIRATNAASLKADFDGDDVEDSQDTEQVAAGQTVTKEV